MKHIILLAIGVILSSCTGKKEDIVINIEPGETVDLCFGIDYEKTYSKAP